MRRLRTVVALGVALAAMVVLARPALADKVPIRIESRPSGAKIYLENRESDPLGTTPYKGTLAEGSYTLIIELDGHEAVVQTIKVARKRGKRPQTFSAELEKVRTATLEIRAKDGDDSADGARVLVDGVEQGNVPDKISVPAGPHQIEIIKDGFKTFEVWVEPSEAERLPVEVALESDGKRRRDDDVRGRDRDRDRDRDDRDRDDDALDRKTRDDDDDGDDVDDVEDDTEIGEGDGSMRGPLVVAGLGLYLAGRHVSFDGNATGERPYDADGIPMGRLELEVYPLATVVDPALGGFGVALTYAMAAPVDSTTRDGEKISTAWSEFDLAARYQYRFAGPAVYGVAGKHHVGLEVGLGGQTFDFTTASGAATSEAALPEIAYRFLRVGVDARISVAPRIALYGNGGYRQVSNIGPLAERYNRTVVSSYSFGAGIGFAVTPVIELRLDGDYIRYNHTLTPSSSDTAEFKATAALDAFRGVSLGAEFRY
jgi:hypothetical protein